MFYTDEQASLLKKARTIYLDGTFKIVRKPFCQLFSVHVFIKGGQSMKQIPVAFVLMSKKRAVDYEYIMSAIKDLLEVNMIILKVLECAFGLAGYDTGTHLVVRDG